LHAHRSGLTRLRAASSARGRRNWRALVPVLALAAAYIAAQGVVTMHDVGPDAHPAGEVCAVCVSVGTLGAANVAAPHVLPISGTHSAAGSVGLLLEVLAPRATYRARAPPFAS
jgi:hypothetical protein